MFIQLPWVEYKKDVSEEEMSYLVSDAANLYSTVSNYEICKETKDGEIVRKSIVTVLFAALYLYHMICQLIDISPLMNPMKFRIYQNDSVDKEHAQDICCQVAKAYTHYIEGSIKYQRDLYQVIAMIADMLYDTFSNGDIMYNYISLEKFLVESKSSRLGLKPTKE